MIPFIVMRCPAYFSLILPPPFAFGAKVLNNVITANARFLVLIIEFPVVFGVYAPHTVFQRAESLMLLTQLRVPLHHPGSLLRGMLLFSLSISTEYESTFALTATKLSFTFSCSCFMRFASVKGA